MDQHPEQTGALADVDLMRRWQAGSVRAFEEIVHRWQGRISRFLSRLVGPTGALQDLCQETFLRLFQARDRYREQGSFSTWLYQVALNVTRDAGRRVRREDQLRDRCDFALVAPPTDAICEKRELADLVQQALLELPASLREVVVLRHYEEISFEEMARLLATPASTLKSRFGTAMRRLRERLRLLGPEDRAR